MKYILLFITAFIFGTVIEKQRAYEEATIIDQPKPQIQDMVNEWDVFCAALIETEKENNPYTDNSNSGAFGYHQALLKGGYLDKYNRLTGDSLTIHHLSTDITLQHVVFDTVQEYYNPTRDFKKALTIHNSKAMNANYMTPYEYKVMYHYYRLMFENRTK